MTRIRCCIILCILISGLPGRVGAAPHFPGDRPLDIEHIRLDVWVELENEYVRASATIFGTARRVLESVELDAVGFREVQVDVHYADMDSQRPATEYDEKKLIVPFKHPLAIGERVEIVVTYTLKSPDRGLNFFGPSDENPEAPYVVWSQGQSTTNRYWIPCFDHPNEMQTTEIRCTVARPYIAVSNGKLMKVSDNADDTRTFHWKMSKPHVAYLTALVVGDFKFKTESWRGIPVTYYVREKFESWIDNSFGHTTAMLEFFSDKIGVPYPWEKYDQVCCYNFGGGMENTSCTILGESTLHDDRAHRDTSSDGLVAHELGHQWFGDLLTCNEWAHLWLNEGFASYCEALWDEESLGADEFSLNMADKSRRARNGGADKPVVYREYKSTGEQFDSRAYSKGAWIVHMIRRRLGDDLFWKSINEYVTRHSHQTVETADLQRVLEAVSGQRFGRFFYDWTARPGHPIVNVRYEWNPDDSMAKIVVEQTQKSEAFHFPLKLEFRSDGGASRTITREITEKRELVYVTLPSRPAAFRVDPDQAVLMELTEEKPLYLWEAQLTDASAALRIAAVRRLAEEGSDASISRLARRLTEEPFWGVQAEIARKLGEDISFRSQQALMAGLGIQHSKALAAVVEALGEFDDEADVLAALEEIIIKGHASYRVEAAAITAYAAACPAHDPKAIELFRSCLSRDSHREMIREAAIDALVRHGDASVIGDLLVWSAADKPREVRTVAIRSLGELASKLTMDVSDSERVIDSLRDFLTKKDRRIRRAAIDAAREMGAAARPLVEEIQSIADASNNRLQRSARRALRDISPPDEDESEIDKLQDSVKSLEEENEALRDRLERLEARLADRGQPAGYGAAAGSMVSP